MSSVSAPKPLALVQGPLSLIVDLLQGKSLLAASDGCKTQNSDETLNIIMVVNLNVLASVL